MAEREAPDALVVIDIQRDDFRGGKLPLQDPEAAAAMAGFLIERFRASGTPVIHVHHHAVRPGSTFLVPGTPGVEPWPSVHPIEGEPVLVKHFPNACLETGLNEVLDRIGARTVGLCGMMTHMCVDATARQAADLGYRILVAKDATATRSLTFGGTTVPAPAVHAAFLAALNGTYGEVLPTPAIVARLDSARETGAR